MKGMILAAGIGSRLKPLTETKPKALVRIGDYTMLQLAIVFLKKYGVSEVIINVHHFADQIISYVEENNSFGIKIVFSDERTKLLNTGGGLVHASDFFNTGESFVLMAVDILTGLNLENAIKHHEESGNLVTLAVKDRSTSRSLLFDDKMRLCGWRHNTSNEHKLVFDNQFSFAKGFSGIHIIRPKIFDLVSEKGAFSIVDLYLRLAANQKIGGFDHSEDEWLEFGRVSAIQGMQDNKSFKQLVTNLYN